MHECNFDYSLTIFKRESAGELSIFHVPTLNHSKRSFFVVIKRRISPLILHGRQDNIMGPCTERGPLIFTKHFFFQENQKYNVGLKK